MVHRHLVSIGDLLHWAGAMDSNRTGHRRRVALLVGSLRTISSVALVSDRMGQQMEDDVRVGGGDGHRRLLLRLRHARHERRVVA